jgi:hypothetical protein
MTKKYISSVIHYLILSDQLFLTIPPLKHYYLVYA